MKVLLIDQQRRRALTEQALKEPLGQGFELFVVDEIGAGLRHLAKAPTDLIVLSAAPDAVSQVTAIRNMVPLLPIVAIDGDDDLALTRRYLQAGVQVHLPQAALTARTLARAVVQATERPCSAPPDTSSRQQGQRLELELDAVKKLNISKNPGVGAICFGLKPLRELVPESFATLVDTYTYALDEAIAASVHKEPGARSTAGTIGKMSDDLGFMQASARDVVDLHTTALRRKIRMSVDSETSVYLEEGRLLLVELMGSLLTFYRRYAFPALRGQSGPEGHG